LTPSEIPLSPPLPASGREKIPKGEVIMGKRDGNDEIGSSQSRTAIASTSIKKSGDARLAMIIRVLGGMMSPKTSCRIFR